MENFKINETIESEQLILNVQGTKCIEKMFNTQNQLRSVSPSSRNVF